MRKNNQLAQTGRAPDVGSGGFGFDSRVKTPSSVPTRRLGRTLEETLDIIPGIDGDDESWMGTESPAWKADVEEAHTLNDESFFAHKVNFESEQAAQKPSLILPSLETAMASNLVGSPSSMKAASRRQLFTHIPYYQYVRSSSA